MQARIALGTFVSRARLVRVASKSPLSVRGSTMEKLSPSLLTTHVARWARRAFHLFVPAVAISRSDLPAQLCFVNKLMKSLCAVRDRYPRQAQQVWLKAAERSYRIEENRYASVHLLR